MRNCVLSLLVLAACGADSLRRVERSLPHLPEDSGGPAPGDADAGAPDGDSNVPPAGDTSPPGDPCANGGCPECTAASDCSSAVDNTAGCYLVECRAGACSATLRHDGPEWRVDPVLSPELEIGDSGNPVKAMWDGQTFTVVMALEGQGVVAKRIEPAAGTVVAMFPLDPAYGDMAFDETNQRFIVVTNEPASEAFMMQHIELQMLGRDGAPLTSKRVLLYDGYNDIGRARVAAGPTNYVVVAQRGTTGTGLVVNPWGETAFVLGLSQEWPYRVMNPNVVAHGDRYVVAATDQHWWVGCPDEQCTPAACPEIWGFMFEAHFTWKTEWTQLVNLSDSTPCETANNLPGLVSGAQGVLLGSGTGNGTGDAGAVGPVAVRTLSNDWQRGPPTSFPVNRLNFLQSVPLGFDGANFLVAPETEYGDRLTAYRFSADGVQLDTTPFGLTPADGISETLPRLAGDRRGRYLIAYKKNSDNGVYARLFSTCP